MTKSLLCKTKSFEKNETMSSDNEGVIASVDDQQQQEEHKMVKSEDLHDNDEEEEHQQKQQRQQEIDKKFEKMNISLSIWPPTQRTRDAVINSLIKTLSSPSILSKRYGSMSQDEASSVARAIEDEAFASASSTPPDTATTATAVAAATTGDLDGIEILQIYSKEISKRMLDAVKAKAASANAPAAAASVSEDISSAEPESS